MRILNKVPLFKPLVLDDLPGNLGIIPNRFPAVVIKCFIPEKLPGYWVRNLNIVSVPTAIRVVLDEFDGSLKMIHLPAVNVTRLFLDELPGHWVSALNKVPVPKAFILDDLPKHLGFIIIIERLLVLDLKLFVLDESSGYWVPISNKVPELKVLVLDDLHDHLGIIPDRLPVVDLKRFVLDESPKY
jgi:hypothetical protein